jgi:hypothetical protein
MRVTVGIPAEFDEPEPLLEHAATLTARAATAATQIARLNMGIPFIGG